MNVQVKRKIPIPSFALPVTPNKSPKDGASETKRVKLAVEMQRMIHLENALQLNLHQQKQQAAPKSDTISFADFSKISSKIEIASLSNENEESKTELESPRAEELPNLVNLSKAERFWFDLYCVAVPDLYHVAEPSMETKDDVPRAKKRRRLVAMALELKPTVNKNLESKNRLGELRRLIRQASTEGIPKSKSEKALSLLLALKQEKENQSELVAASKSSNDKKSNESSIVDSLLRDTNATTKTPIATTTIDDRIRARAKERERNLEQAKAARKDPREERVTIADALYSYACHILRRKQSRSRFSVNKPSKTAASKKCTLTFQEIVQKCLPNQSRKEITRILLDIVKVLSANADGTSFKFLKWKDLRTGQLCGVPISKNTSVTIDTSDFKNVREILNREKISEEN